MNSIDLEKNSAWTDRESYRFYFLFDQETNNTTQTNGHCKNIYINIYIGSPGTRYDPRTRYQPLGNRVKQKTGAGVACNQENGSHIISVMSRHLPPLFATITLMQGRV